jgi:hypothetical protein
MKQITGEIIKNQEGNIGKKRRLEESKEEWKIEVIWV